jgi:hypothetical protein
VSNPFLNNCISDCKHEVSKAYLNIFSSNTLPNKILSLIEPDIMNGSCSTYATVPFIFLEPDICLVSSRIEYRKVVLPEPT